MLLQVQNVRFLQVKLSSWDAATAGLAAPRRWARRSPGDGSGVPSARPSPIRKLRVSIRSISQGPFWPVKVRFEAGTGGQFELGTTTQP